MLFHVAVIHSFHFIVKVLLEREWRKLVYFASLHCLEAVYIILLTVEFQSVDGMEVYLTSLILMSMWILQAFVICAHGIMLM